MLAAARFNDGWIEPAFARLGSCGSAPSAGLVMPRDRLELQDRLMDRENGVGFVYDNRVDMRNRALEITTPPMLDGGVDLPHRCVPGTGFDAMRVAD